VRTRWITYLLFSSCMSDMHLGYYLKKLLSKYNEHTENLRKEDKWGVDKHETVKFLQVEDWSILGRYLVNLHLVIKVLEELAASVFRVVFGFLWNVGNWIPVDTLSYSRRLQPSLTMLWKPQMIHYDRFIKDLIIKCT